MVTFIPYTRLRPRGVGSGRSIASRATEIVSRGTDLCANDPAFCFCIDSSWAVVRAFEADDESLARVRSAVTDGRLSIGAAWAGVDWVTDPECLIRDVIIGIEALVAMGIEPSEAIYLRGRGCLPVSIDDLSSLATLVPAGCENATHDLGLRLLSPQVVVQRDAERDLDSAERVIPLGEELWCPTSDQIEMLRERVGDAGHDVAFATWSDQAISGFPLDAIAPYREAFVPGVYAKLFDTTNALLRLERTQAMGTLLGDATGLDLTGDWRQHLEDLAGDYTGSGDERKRSDLAVSCDAIAARCKAESEAIERNIAASVDAGEGPDGIVPLVVFNSACHPQSGLVESHVVYYGASRATSFERYEFYRIVDSDGEPVTVEEVGGKQVETAEIRLRFVAKDVPALGYKTYYLVPKPQEQSGDVIQLQAPGVMVPDFPEPTFAVDDVEDRVAERGRGLRVGRTFSVGEFYVEVDETTGVIDVRDREGGTLLKGARLEAREGSLDAEPGHFVPSGRVHPNAVTRVDLVESGAVTAKLRVSGMIGTSPVTLDAQMYADLPWLDFEVTVSWKETIPAMLEWVSSVGEPFTGGRLGRPFGSEAWHRDSACVADRWVECEAGPKSFFVGADRCRLYLEGGTLRAPLLLSAPDPASYAYNKLWMSYPSQLTYAFRLSLDSGPPTWGDRLSCQEVYDRHRARTRPASQGTLCISPPAFRVSSVRPVTGGVEVRGHSASSELCRVEVDASVRSTRVDLRGRGDGESGTNWTIEPDEILTLHHKTD